MTLLLTVLGVVLCSLAASPEVLPQADLNLQAMAGKWYLIGFASNAQWFIERKASMKMGTAMFNPTADGDLDLSYASLKPDGSCWRLNNLARKTNSPGKFLYTSRGDDNEMLVVDVRYDEYALIHVIKAKGGVLTIVNKLYGRSMNVNPDLLEKFRQFSLETGIVPENIAFLPRNAECPPA